MVYTSYFGNLSKLKSKGITVVSIALWKPKWYSGNQYLILAPMADMLKRDLSREEYIKEYKTRVLSRLNPRKVYYDLINRFGNNIALLCYEKPYEFCHRQLVAQWFKESGLDIEEFAEIVESVEKPKEPEHKQLELF